MNEKILTSLRNLSREIEILRWAYHQGHNISKLLFQLIGQLWYWRLFPKEYLGLRQNRWKYNGLYKEEKENPLVSITIPTYDRGQLLVERVLPTIQAQTHQNFEVVIVGDCSPPETVALLSQIKDPRVRFYNLPERPKYPKDPVKRHMVAGSPPLNKAMELARGKWLALGEDDDVFTPDHIEKLLAFAQAGDYEWVTGAFLEERIPGELTHCVDPERNWTLENRAASISCWLCRAYIRAFKFDSHAWRYEMGGDGSVKKRLRRAGVRMGYLNHVVTHKLMRPGERFLYEEAVIDRISRGVEG